jgi:predicted negative regulator of RcsB-dependent stress response
MEQFADAELRGDLAGEELEEANRYWANHLRRGSMNAIESALYSAAEIHLQRNNPKSAIESLQKVLDAKAAEELLDLTHLNLGEVYRRRLSDAANAAKHYRLVGGPHRHYARHYLLRMLAEAGQAKEAGAYVEELVTKSPEKGEKLALLHRLAGIYKQSKMPDEALAIYQRIAAEFTPKDIETMRQAAVAEVEAAIKRIRKLRRADQGDEAERAEEKIHARARDLELAQRWDELKAFQDAADKGFRILEREADGQPGGEIEKPPDKKGEL